MPMNFDMDTLHPLLRQWRMSGQRIVFTNGVFDILHAGHVMYLQEAARSGDRLVVGINSDESVRRLNKGPDRPVNGEEARAFVIAALRCVDAVIVFGEDTPLDIIRKIDPDVLVKGGDYDPDEREQNSPRYMVGSDFVREKGGDVRSIPLLHGFSTTHMIRKIRGDK